MEEKLARYFELKEAQRALEAELDELRKELIRVFPGPVVCEIGGYRLKVAVQERRDYRDEALYAKLPDPGLWRHVSKADAGKVTAMVKMNLLSEDMLEGAYSVKQVPVLQVSRL
ncbi:hypothetical protein J31TS4_40040 [Paenibacillus sp. J31TS4]|uniref:hypothetical protein n=1 Tax=Paenibacillus sp. J31TS4 TaxID=2807195 RepID=UPI001B213F50|nr:hypothetical protein [Paenibacillus sp. J31TS4]GIP40724.1 hypothetical protein J31TS4_40040 [Paenibacillus sp. J31TS4]